jgi:hypothetical protein
MKLNQFKTESMSSLLVFLQFALANDQYYTTLIDILLRQEKYIDTIYEGARKLVAGNKLSSWYF